MFRFSTSNTILQLSVIGILSPLARVSNLLSSSTVLRFSIQIASTGPSHVSQVFYLIVLLLAFFHKVENIPGVYSCDTSSLIPYIWALVMALGFRILLCHFYPPLSASRFDKHSVKILNISVFPLPAVPTNMNPCLTLVVSKS